VTTVFVIGVALLAAVAVADLARAWRWTYLVGAAASACLLVAGAGALAGHTFVIDLDDVFGVGADTLIADRLSGLFLVIAFGAAVPVSLALTAWTVRKRRGLGACYGLTLVAVAVVVTARNAFVFLFAWEALTIAFYLLAGFDRDKPGRPTSALVTLAFGKISGAALLVGLLLLAGRAGSFSLTAFGDVPGGALRSTAYTLLVAGFAIKTGLVPMQVWMPRGYAAAPGPHRAIMAGVAVNVGFYGLWRTLDLLGSPPAWLIGTVLILAAITALLGISHAAVQTDLQRVVAYSSVENTGLILTGYGIALVGAATDLPTLVAAGMVAGTLQIVAHTAAKSLLFITSAQIETAAGTNELDDLGGTGRRLRWSGAGFAIGACTLAGLPPTAGFVSEWFLLEALMQQFRLDDLPFQLVLAVSGAAIALTAGFAAVTFIRLVGLVILGPRRPADVGADYGVSGRAGIVLLGLGCLAIAAVTPLEIRVIAAGLSPIVPAALTGGALKSPWVLQPVFADFSVLSPSWLWIAMPTLLVVVVAFSLLVSGRRMLRVRRVPAWRSATAGVEGADQYTASGYTNPTRKVLANVLHTRTELRQLERRAEGGAHLGYRSDVIEVVEDYLYRPLVRPVLAAVHALKRLQSGRLDAYIAYMLIVLIGVLAVVTALA
jgi:formate hydrogenlyase subunit 3/multisubunit Na+/H+ antiporter MnhD subunit